MRAASLAVLATVLLLSGCVSGRASPAQLAGSSSPITREELDAIPPGSAFEAVSRLRIQWLRGHSGSFRSETGRNYPEVFVDGRPFGALDSLHQIGTEAIDTIRFHSASDATTRFGTGYPAGIIEVITRRSPRPMGQAWGGLLASPSLLEGGPTPSPPGTCV